MKGIKFLNSLSRWQVKEENSNSSFSPIEIPKKLLTQLDKPQDKYKTICRYLETEIGFTQATVSFKPSAELSKELRDRRTRNNRIDSNWEQQQIRNQ